MTDLRYEMPQLAKRYIWKWGMPADLWLANVRFVAEFIEKRGIEVTDPRDLMADDPVPIVMLAPQGREEMIREFIGPQPFPGGKRTPHLHFKGDFYALDAEQWAEFSGAMVERFQAKLEHASTVPFTKVIELGEAIETM